MTDFPPLPGLISNRQHSIQLISVTPNAEKIILYCARVSSDQSKTSTGLLDYLIRNKHWSPFEMAHMVIEIVTSRAISQQIIRHRSFSFQEFSQRYAKANNAISYDARMKGSTNRQSSLDTAQLADQEWWYEEQENIAKAAFKSYNDALDLGIAPECARMVLPLSTQTQLYMAGSLRSWIHYFDLRCDEHTQLEHKEIANDIRVIFDGQFPIIAEALKQQ